MRPSLIGQSSGPPSAAAYLHIPERPLFKSGYVRNGSIAEAHFLA